MSKSPEGINPEFKEIPKHIYDGLTGRGYLPEAYERLLEERVEEFSKQ